MLSAFAKAIEQLPDSRFLRVVLMGVVGAIIALAALWTAAGWLLDQVSWADLPLIGGMFEGYESEAGAVGWVAFALGAGGLTWILFPVTAVAVITLFLDSVCEAVESRHYPGRGAARQQPILEIVFEALKFLGITVLLNLIALPIYLVLLFLFGTGAFVFLLVNGYLVGREFFELVALRRMDPHSARRLRKAYSGRIILMGILSVLLMAIPLINLVAPVLAAAAMLHLYEGLPRKAEFEASAAPAAEAV